MRQPDYLRISHEHHADGLTVVTLKGDADVYTSPKLREALVELITDGHVLLVIDMTDVDLFDSTGFGVLVGALKRTRVHDGGVGIVNPQPHVLKRFRLTGLSKVFPIFKDLARAEEQVPRLFAPPLRAGDGKDRTRQPA